MSRPEGPSERDWSESRHMTPDDLYATAEAGKAVLRVDRSGLSTYYTPVFEVLPNRWVGYSEAAGEAAVVPPEAVEVDLRSSETEARLVPRERSPFGDDHE